MPRRKPMRKCVMKLMRSGFTKRQARKECDGFMKEIKKELKKEKKEK